MREVTKRKPPRVRSPVCVVHTGSPAVLGVGGPLRNSLVRPVGIATGRSRPRAACGASVRALTPVLGHARFPLRFAPLLGAPEGPRFLRPGFLPGFRRSPCSETCGRVQGRSH
jgi:hypothetical protein